MSLVLGNTHDSSSKILIWRGTYYGYRRILYPDITMKAFDNSTTVRRKTKKGKERLSGKGVATGRY